MKVNSNLNEDLGSGFRQFVTVSLTVPTGHRRSTTVSDLEVYILL